jgi:hypothetical protein
MQSGGRKLVLIQNQGLNWNFCGAQLGLLWKFAGVLVDQECNLEKDGGLKCKIGELGLFWN